MILNKFKQMYLKIKNIKFFYLNLFINLKRSTT
ncbi:hypothetical protein GUU_02823 [Malacoplasma iowae 695]|nr:hypothetical protein GUU_02823 [Malacoplasma iowae 695]